MLRELEHQVGANRTWHGVSYSYKEAEANEKAFLNASNKANAQVTPSHLLVNGACRRVAESERACSV